ncbi:MAG: DUF3887 domain-containing protein [Candidatus Hydrogenedentes bacterium]|nr:DUF3887 domain-containing protein [Candidatus Hydrogenedentota bacterium]
MTETKASTGSLRTWLFNPFHYVAGGTSLGLGLAIILVTGFLGSLSNSHFDGVLDFHTGAPAPLAAFLVTGIINWACMGIALYLAGLIASKTRPRLLDVAGTQALARTPVLLTALVALLPGYQRYSTALATQLSTLAQGTPMTDPMALLLPEGTSAADLATFAAVVFVALVAVVWMVALMYRAFAVSCNLRGVRGAVAFIPGLVAAWAASKALVIGMLVFASSCAPGVSEDEDANYAANIETTEAGRQFVALLVGGQFDAAVGRFDNTMAKAMPVPRLEQVWKELIAKSGPYKEVAGVRVERQGKLRSAFVTCLFEKESHDIQVVVSPSGEICGLWLREPSVQPEKE